MKTEFRWLMVCFCVLITFNSLSAFEGPEEKMRRPRFNNDRHLIQLTPEDEAESLEYLKLSNEDLYKDLIAVKESRPEFYKRALSRVFREMHYLEGLKKEDPERYEKVLDEKKLEKSTRELAKKYKKSVDDTEKEKMKAELSSMLYKLFEYRQMNRQYEIKRLEERLESLKEDMANRLDNKDEIIERRMNKLLGEDESLEW